MQVAILLILLNVDKLDDAQKVRRLKVGHECVDQSRLVIDMHLVDTDQVLDHFVACRVESERRQELQ